MKLLATLSSIVIVFGGICLTGCAERHLSGDVEARLQSLENKVASYSDLRLRVDALEQAARAKGILEPALSTEKLPARPETEAARPQHSDFVVSAVPGQKNITVPPTTATQPATGSQSKTPAPLAGKPPMVVKGQITEPPLPQLDNVSKTQGRYQSQAKSEPAPQGVAPRRNAPAPAPKPAPKTEKGVYEAALALQNSGKYADSRNAMTTFLENYPKGPYVPNALYWIGESYYSQSRWDQAVLSFKDVVSRFPRHAKAADALLKLGMSYEQLKDEDNARFHYETLLEDFPDSRAAGLAKQKLAGL